MLRFYHSSQSIGCRLAHFLQDRRTKSVLASAVFLVIAGTTTGAVAQSAGQWKTPEQIYGSVCAYCHDARIGPTIRGRQLDEGMIVAIVTNGLRQMPAFRPTDFSDDELKALARWLHDSAKPSEPAEVKR
ncbi:c-type cytochrome [Bradyrhizobium macuxiense]|uniref:c-type cytochrome n=1 Tax=Bradyrhizobium macuxiense TaxID=1755647 RepID=UPI0009E9DE5B|nr:cytochrome c [Bradyrhizobium macuxiense]